MSKESIIEKIKKLMNVVNDSATGSEEERDTALKMVQKLLVKHRIEMSEIEEKEEGITEQTVVLYNSQYSRIIFSAISRMNFCSFYYRKIPNRPTYANFTFIGKEHEIFATIELCKSILFSVNKESRKGAKIHAHDKHYSRSFVNSASVRISKRVNEIIEDSKKNNDETGNALIIINAYDNAVIECDNYLNNKNLKLITKKPRNINIKSFNGYNDGDNFGKKVNLNIFDKIS